ncbi:MAG: sulfite oxidase [Acidobacteriota bacterium]
MSVEGKHRDFIVRSRAPLNGGPNADAMQRDFLTPNDQFFVRNHGDVPAVDPASYRLHVDGLCRHPREFTLAEIADLPRRKVVSTLQCAGARRTELMAVEAIPNELAWGPEAMSNAAWEGVPLAEVLRLVEPEESARHVAFQGLDEVTRDNRTFGFGGSIPLDKATANEVLLADRMNGEPLPPLHGFPLRMLVPGYISARSVKWLRRITLQAEPSDNYFQAKAYRLFPPHVRRETVRWEEGLMLGELPVNCVITHPGPEDTVGAGTVEVRGVALVGGGRTIARVDLSSDGGRNWISADLGEDRGPWAWRFWEGRVAVSRGRREIVARAFDSSANTQPEEAAKLWNFKGYMNNSWARVRVLGQ